MKYIALAVFVIVLGLMTSCGMGDTHPLSSFVGERCCVQFKRNALGGSDKLPVPPTTNSINGADVSLSGILRTVSNDGLLIETEEKSKCWVPMDSVLLVQDLK